MLTKLYFTENIFPSAEESEKVGFKMLVENRGT